MTASLLVVIPVALLVFVAGFCFVGCISLDTKGNQFPPYTHYRDVDLMNEGSLVAFWPLDDKMGPTAKDWKGTHDGTYVNVDTAGEQYPCPAYVVNPAIPVTTAFAGGTQTIGAKPGIVDGDTEEPHDVHKVAPTACMKTDGGYVTVPHDAVFNPDDSWTVEAWALPQWKPDDIASRQVIDSRDQDGAIVSGYGLRVNDDGDWEVLIGHTNAMGFLPIAAGKASHDTPSHVVMTLQADTIRVFVNGEPIVSKSLPMGATYSANKTKPFIIGASSAYLATRNTKDPNYQEGPSPLSPLFPLLPWNGLIQDVAVYNSVLSDETIKKHFDHGTGKKDPDT